MVKQAAGLLVYRKAGDSIEVFLVHPGGPFYVNKDDGVWSIPKGLFDADEEPLAAARREFEEETGQKIAGDYFELKPVTQKGGKIVYAWAVEANVDAENIVSNTFELEWPPKSGKMELVPEVDRGGWFDVETAKRKINPAQAALVDEMVSRV